MGVSPPIFARQIQATLVLILLSRELTSTGLLPFLASLSRDIRLNSYDLLRSQKHHIYPNVSKREFGLACSGFTRRYYRNHDCFLFLQVLECFGSLGTPPLLAVTTYSAMTGNPIRESADRRQSASPRSISLLTAPFIGTLAESSTTWRMHSVG